MKRILPFAILAAVLAAAVALQSLQGRGSKGYEAPDFELRDLEGDVHRLSELRGKVVFLNVWATWCPPCIAEMPSIEALHRRFRDTDLVVLAVSEDAEGEKAVRPVIERLDLSFPILLDPEGTLSPRYGVTGYPETFLIGRDGRVVEHFIGPTDWVSAERINYFQTLLRQPPGVEQAAGQLSAADSFSMSTALLTPGGPKPSAEL
jgi:peroxiredoxin